MKTLQELKKEKEELERALRQCTGPDSVIDFIDDQLDEVNLQISKLTPKINRNSAGLFVPAPYYVGLPHIDCQDNYYLDDKNRTVFSNFSDQNRVGIGNCYPDEASAKKAQLRRGSMIPTYLPKVGDWYCYIFWNYDEWNIYHRQWNNEDIDWFYYYTGRCFVDEKGAEDWIKKYSEAWRGL